MKDVPVELRIPPADEDDDDGLSIDWQIAGSDNTERVKVLENRIGKRFPPSFRDFLSRYSFPAFEFGPVMFFANTGHDLFWELGRRLFLDPPCRQYYWTRDTSRSGILFSNSDPVCIQSGPEGVEGRIVQLDHDSPPNKRLQPAGRWRMMARG